MVTLVPWVWWLVVVVRLRFAEPVDKVVVSGSLGELCGMVCEFKSERGPRPLSLIFWQMHSCATKDVVDPLPCCLIELNAE